jgi:membrane protein
MPTFGPQATEDLYALGRRLGESFLGRSVIRFVSMAGFDRSIVLSSQAFTALIPLLILAASLAPADQDDVISNALIRRFALTGESAQAVEQLFSTTADASSTVSAFSAVLLLFSGISFTRRLQRMYRAGWAQEREGVRSTLYAALGMIALLVEFGVVYGIRSLGQQVGTVWLWTVPVQVITGLFLWTSVPYLLMNKQVHWRRLLVGGATAALATTAFAAATTLYMPATITRYTNDFGLFGITIAIIGWLLAVSVILVASTAIGAEFDAARGARVMAFKVRFHLHGPGEDMTPLPPTPGETGLTTADVLLLVRVLVNWLILSAAVWVATLVVPGLDVDGGVVTYLALSVLFGLVNAVLGPLLHLVAMPLSVVTLGSFAVVINGVLLATTAGLSERFAIGGLGDAVLGALVIAIVTTTLELVVRPMRPRTGSPTLPEP